VPPQVRRAVDRGENGFISYSSQWLDWYAQYTI